MNKKDVFLDALSKLGLWTSDWFYYVIGILGGIFIPGMLLYSIFLRDQVQLPDAVLVELTPFFQLIWDDVIVPPLIEEFIFRGLIWGSIEMMFGRKAAAVMTFMFFVFAHNDSIDHMTGVIPLTILLTSLRYESGSLFPGILAHFVNNLFVVLTLATFGILEK